MKRGRASGDGEETGGECGCGGRREVTGEGSSLESALSDSLRAHAGPFCHGWQGRAAKAQAGLAQVNGCGPFCRLPTFPTCACSGQRQWQLQWQWQGWFAHTRE